jgi:beta-phosphoglucomutase
MSALLKYFKYLLLDHDGVVSATEWLHYEARRRVLLREYGIKLTIEYYCQYLMSRGPESQFETFRQIPAAVHSALFDECQRVYATLLDQVEAVPGINELILRACDAGMRVAIATTQPREIVERCIGVTLTDEARAVVEFIETVHGVLGAKNKPAPDVYRLTMARLGAQPHQCVAIEDSPSGVKAAKAAGVYTVGLPGFTSAEDLRAAGADVVVSSHDEIMFGH